MKKQSPFHASLLSSAKHNNRYLRIWHYSTLCGMLLTSRWQKCIVYLDGCSKNVDNTPGSDAFCLLLYPIEAWVNWGALNLPIGFTSSKNNFTDDIPYHSSTALARFNLSRQRGNDSISHLYAEHNLATHHKKYLLTFLLSFEKHSGIYIGWFLAKYWSYEVGTLTTQ